MQNQAGISVIDWIAIRQEMRRLRLAATLEESALAELGVTSLSNVYRIENTADSKKHRPDLETVSKWLAHTSGESLGAFLLRLGAAGVAGLGSPAPPLAGPESVELVSLRKASGDTRNDGPIDTDERARSHDPSPRLADRAISVDQAALVGRALLEAAAALTLAGHALAESAERTAADPRAHRSYAGRRGATPA